MDDADRYLSRVAQGYRVRVYHGSHHYSVGTFRTQEEARAARDAKLAELAGQQPPAIPQPVTAALNAESGWTYQGVTACEEPDEEAVWQRACEGWRAAAALELRRQSQCVRFPGPVVTLVAEADQHLGGAGVDYPGLMARAEIIRDTPGMFLVTVGDVVDNFVKAKFAHVRMETRLAIPDEAVLARRYLRVVASKLVASVGGNHEHWTEMLSGIDYFAEVIAGVSRRALYDPDECKFDLVVGEKTWRVKMRHRWRGSSIYNATHGIERSARFDEPFRVGIGAHTHVAGLSREFVVNGQTCLAVLCGSSKRVDSYPRQLGLPKPNNSTAIAVMFDARDGTMTAFGDLDEAARLTRQTARV